MARTARRRRLPWPFKLVAPAVVTGATTYLSLVNHEVVPASKAWSTTAIVSVGVVTFGGAVASIAHAKSEQERMQSARDVREALVALVFGVRDRTATDVRDINAVYLEKRWRFAWRRSDRWRILVPAVRVELGAHEPSSVIWTRGKGVIGKAWEHEQVQFKDLRAFTRRWSGCGADGWAKSQLEKRTGLTFHDWQQTQGKYGTVVAACTRDNGTITGVLAVNGPMSSDWTQSEHALKEMVVLTAKTISNLVR